MYTQRSEMASLTQTSILARKTIRYTIYGIIFLLIARVVIGTGVKIFRFFFPEPPPPPTVTFGKLPTLPFPEGAISSENLTFSLETATGDLPKFIDQLPAYFMPKPAAGISDLENAKEKSISLGFSSSERELVETVFLFQHRTAPSTLTLNIVSGIFSISYDLRADPEVIERQPPSIEEATKLSKSFLMRADLLADDIDTGPITHDFIKIEEGRFLETVSLSESDLIKINLFRKNFDEIPSVTEDPKEANVWFMISGSENRERQIIAAEYKYYALDEEQSATYPLKTAKQAWEDLNSGKGFIANLDGDQTSIKIRNVYLGYYDAGQYTEFYQPVVVFEGDNNFVAYVPAITDEYYGN